MAATASGPLASCHRRLPPAAIIGGRSRAIGDTWQRATVLATLGAVKSHDPALAHSETSMPLSVPPVAPARRSPTSTRPAGSGQSSEVERREGARGGRERTESAAAAVLADHRSTPPVDSRFLGEPSPARRAAPPQPWRLRSSPVPCYEGVSNREKGSANAHADRATFAERYL